MAEFGKNTNDLAAWDIVAKDLKDELFQGVMLCVSGGLDSTALLHAFAAFTKGENKFSIGVFHVAYGLRGEDSAGDLAFCRELAAAYGWPFFLREVSAEERSGRSSESLQAWARRLRRDEFARFAATGWLMALGHHRDDLAENVLLRLARGSGPGQLLGMEPWRPPLWRPLLSRSKAELAQYLRDRRLPWREDASNAEPVYARNRVRQRVLPELEALYPGAAARLVACAEEARDMIALADAALKTGHLPQAPLARGVKRHLRAAALTKAGVRLSRRRLDATDTGKPAEDSVAGSKRKRRLQHERALSVQPPELLLEPSSYAFFSCPGGLWQLGLATPDSIGGHEPDMVSRSLRLRPLAASDRHTAARLPPGERLDCLMLSVGRGELRPFCRFQTASASKDEPATNRVQPSALQSAILKDGGSVTAGLNSSPA